jgi:hypothetical protein
MRLRTLVLAVGSALVGAALLATDPDGGIATGMLGLGLVTPLIAVAFAHVMRKVLHDYPEADMQRLFRKAGETATGSGLALVALAIVLSALLALFGRGAHAQVPERAHQHLPALAVELDRHWPDAPMRTYLPGLIEHESCISLTHSRCWSSTARLKTQREEGAGLGQLTRAWNPDGTERFDALAELRARHAVLRELDWRTVYLRPDLQLRAVVLMSRDNFVALGAVPDPLQRLAMADAAYNGGMTGLQRERRACQMASGCDPAQWWGHVELRCLKNRAALYAGRSPCDINRHHVKDVIQHRAPKYQLLIDSRVPSLGVRG